MPRGIPNKKKTLPKAPTRAQETKSMSPEEYETTFGRKKPGPAPGFKKKAAAPKPTAKSGYFAPGRVKPGPKPGFKKGKAKVTVSVTTGRWSSKKTNASQAAKAAPKGKDLGPPPRRLKPDLGTVTQAALDLGTPDLQILLEQIELKLAGDTSSFGPEEWGTVQELMSSGYSRLNAIETVRKDTALDTETSMAETTEADETSSIPPAIDPSAPVDEIDEDEEGDEEDEGDDEEDETEDEEPAGAVANSVP